MKLTTEQLPDAYERGICRDCLTRIQPLGSSSRCEPCDFKFQEYIDSDWGLAEISEERTRNRILGLCMVCGDGLNGNDNWLLCLCASCYTDSETGRRSRKNWVNDENPYYKLWDSRDDHSINLTPTYGTMAQRFLAKARYFHRKSERGGPRGREYAQEARDYFNIARELQEKVNIQLSRYKMQRKFVPPEPEPAVDPDVKQAMYAHLAQWLGMDD